MRWRVVVHFKCLFINNDVIVVIMERKDKQYFSWILDQSWNQIFLFGLITL